MTHPGPDQPPQQRPAEPTRAVQLPKPPPPPAGGGQQAPPPPRPAEQAPPQGWAPPGQPAGHQGGYTGWAPPGQPAPGWAPPGQAPHGQPPQAQQPYQSWGPGPQGQGTAASSGGRTKLWLSIAGGVVALAAGLGAFFLLSGSAEPEVGDCITLNSDGQAETVDCGSGDAQFRVIGVQEGEQSYEEYLDDPATCVDFPGTTQSAWFGDEGGTGTVYCAEDA